MVSTTRNRLNGFQMGVAVQITALNRAIIYLTDARSSRSQLTLTGNGFAAGCEAVALPHRKAAPSNWAAPLVRALPLAWSAWTHRGNVQTAIFSSLRIDGWETCRANKKWAEPAPRAQPNGKGPALRRGRAAAAKPTPAAKPLRGNLIRSDGPTPRLLDESSMLLPNKSDSVVADSLRLSVSRLRRRQVWLTFL